MHVSSCGTSLVCNSSSPSESNDKEPNQHNNPVKFMEKLKTVWQETEDQNF